MKKILEKISSAFHVLLIAIGNTKKSILKGIALLYCAQKDLQLVLDTYKTTMENLRKEILDYLGSKETMYSQFITTAKRENIYVPIRQYLLRTANRILIRIYRRWCPASLSCKMLSSLMRSFSRILHWLGVTIEETTESVSPIEEQVQIQEEK